MYEHALVLSGGGANGAYQNGVVQGLAEGIAAGSFPEPDLIVGTSVGSLNGSKLAEFSMGNFALAAQALDEEWDSIRENDDIYKPHLFGMIPSALLMALKLKKSVYNTSPLQKRVRKNLSAQRLRDSDRHFICNAVELGNNSDSRWFHSGDEHVVEGVLASSAFPVFFEPIKIGERYYTDGGVRDQTPIGKAIAMGAKRITVVTCDSGRISKQKGLPKGIDQVGRVLKVLLDEIDTDDFVKATLINHLVMADAPIARKNGWRFVEMDLIRPSSGLGESLDFSREKNESLRARGLMDALAFLDRG